MTGENTSFFVGFIIPLALLLHLFPTGGYLTRRWTWAGWLAAVTSLAFVVDALFSVELHIADAAWTVINPIGFLSPFVETGSQCVAGIGLLTLMIGGIVAIVVRYRQSDSVVRSQVRLVALSLIFFIATTLYPTADRRPRERVEPHLRLRHIVDPHLNRCGDPATPPV